MEGLGSMESRVKTESEQRSIQLVKKVVKMATSMHGKVPICFCCSLWSHALWDV